MDRSASLTVAIMLVCSLVFVRAQDEFITIHPQDDQWYEVGSDAVVTCQWEYQYYENITNEAVILKQNKKGIRKDVRDGDSFVYDTSPIAEDRQDFSVEWEGKIKQAVFTIHGFSVSDPTDITCEVEAVRAQTTETFHIYQYNLPTVTMRDFKSTTIDIRTPVPEPEQPAANETDTETIPETGNDSDYNDTSEEIPEDTDDYPDTNEEDGTNNEDDVPDYVSDEASDENKIIVECVIEMAYPRPSKVVFVIGETDTIEAADEDINILQDEDSLYFYGTAKLELDANKMYDGKSISCKVEIPTKPEAMTVDSANSSSVITILHDATEVTAVISPYIAVENDDVQITCRGDGNPRPTFTVIPSANVQPTDDPTTFRIVGVTRQDAGSYACEATSPSREDPEKTIEIENETAGDLTVYYLDEPTLSETKDEVERKKGESLSVDCYGNGSPYTTERWMRDGQVVQEGNGGLLKFDKISYDQEGEYTCESTSSSDYIGTKKTKKISLKVSGACEAELTVATVAASNEEANAFLVRLECKVTGQPACLVSIESQKNFKPEGTSKTINANQYQLEYAALKKQPAPVSFFCVASNNAGLPVNVSYVLDQTTDAGLCCESPKQGGLSTGAIIGIILLVIVVVIGIPVACYFVKKRNAEPKKKAPSDAEAAAPEKEGLNKDESSEDSETGSLPPPPADMDNDHRLNSAHEMTTFSTNQ